MVVYTWSGFDTLLVGVCVDSVRLYLSIHYSVTSMEDLFVKLMFIQSSLRSKLMFIQCSLRSMYTLFAEVYLYVVR